MNEIFRLRVLRNIAKELFYSDANTLNFFSKSVSLKVKGVSKLRIDRRDR